jgi:5-methylcytosine-specific restriction endonuclease McrA
MEFPPPFAQFSNDDLIAETKRLAVCERQATVHLIACLMEVDARRLYLGEGCSSLFTYCTQVLNLSEHAAYGRIEAARAARRFPKILELLADGELTLMAVNLLAPHLTPDNHLTLLKGARHKSKREVEHLLAHVHPQPDAISSVRKLPAPKPQPALADVSVPHDEHVAASSSDQRAKAGDLASAKRPAVVVPLAPERYKVQLTVSRETYEKLRRAQDLLRHTIPDGDPAAVFDRALTLLVSELERTRLAAATKARQSRSPSAPSSRHIPAEVKRAVWTRDAGRCAFVGTEGRCAERGFLEFHHVVPYAAGGAATFDNIQLRCAAHNAHEGELYFGRRQPPLVRETTPRTWSGDAGGGAVGRESGS